MDVLRNLQPKRRKQALFTPQKINVLTTMNCDSRNCMFDNRNTDSGGLNQNLHDTGEVISFLQSEQFYVECLKHLKKCLIQPLLKGSIDSLDDITDLVDEMFTTHSSVCSNIISEKSDMSNVLKILLATMDAYFSYSILINLEMKNFQKLSEAYTDVYIDFDLLQEPLMHISRYKTVFQNLYHAIPDEAYCVLKAIEVTSQNLENSLLLKKNALRTLQIQQLLFKREPKILIPGRIVLKEGVLYKVSSRSSCLKKRVFFLFNDIFLCCKVLSKTSDWHEKSSLLFQALFPLEMCIVSLVMNSKKQGALFKVICGTVSFLLTSKYPGEAQSWFYELEVAIRTCRRSIVNLKPKLKRQTNISLRHMKRISPSLKSIECDSQKQVEDEVTYSSHNPSTKPSPGILFRLSCTSVC